MTTRRRPTEPAAARVWLSPEKQMTVDFRTDPKRAAERKVRPINWRGGHMRGIQAVGGHFVNAIVSYCDLSLGWLGDADLSGAKLYGANLTRTSLVGANLSGAALVEAKLTEADLSSARLTDAQLQDADLTGADLAGADLTGADFVSGGVQSPTCGLTQAQLDLAVADADRPPMLEGLLDAETGVPLIWRGEAPGRAG